MCIIDGSIACIIDPISNAIYNYIAPFIYWLINGISLIISFISQIILLGASIVGLISGLLSDCFNTNADAAIVFGLILSGISLIIALRIYNLFAGVSIWGFKLPKL